MATSKRPEMPATPAPAGGIPEIQPTDQTPGAGRKLTDVSARILSSPAKKGQTGVDGRREESGRRSIRRS